MLAHNNKLQPDHYYLAGDDAVLLADVHLGKSAHFRKHGMAVPSQADDNEYDKLNA